MLWHWKLWPWGRCWKRTLSRSLLLVKMDSSIFNMDFWYLIAFSLLFMPFCTLLIIHYCESILDTLYWDINNKIDIFIQGWILYCDKSRITFAAFCLCSNLSTNIVYLVILICYNPSLLWKVHLNLEWSKRLWEGRACPLSQRGSEAVQKLGAK